MCAEEEAAVCPSQAAPCCQSKTGNMYLGTVHSELQKQLWRFLEGSRSSSPWQRPAESGAQEQEVCLTMFYLCSRQVCPARVGTGQQHSTSEVHRGPACPAPGSAAGGSLHCSAALNLSAKSSYMYFPVICAIHGKVTHCLSDFPADSLHTK